MIAEICWHDARSRACCGERWRSRRARRPFRDPRPPESLRPMTGAPFSDREIHVLQILAAFVSGRRAEDGEVLGEEIDQPPVDGAVAGKPRRRRGTAGPPCRKSRQRWGHRGVDLDERAGVEQQLDALAGGEFAVVCWRATRSAPPPAAEAARRRSRSVSCASPTNHPSARRKARRHSRQTYRRGHFCAAESGPAGGRRRTRFKLCPGRRDGTRQLHLSRSSTSSRRHLLAGLAFFPLIYFGMGLAMMAGVGSRAAGSPPPPRLLHVGIGGLFLVFAVAYALPSFSPRFSPLAMAHVLRRRGGDLAASRPWARFSARLHADRPLPRPSVRVLFGVEAP